MRQVWRIARLHLKRAFTTKANLFMMFLLPLLLTFIFGLMLAGQSSPDGSSVRSYPIAVIDQDNTFASRELVKALTGEAALKVRAVSSADEVKKLFADRKIDSAVVIPAGFQASLAGGTAPDVQLVTAPGGNVYVGVGPIVRREASRLGQDYLLALKASGAKAGDAAAEEAYAKVAAERAKLNTTLKLEQASRAEAPAGVDTGALLGTVTVGFTVTFVMMMVFMQCGVILQERQAGTWGRLLTTPTPRGVILSGYLLSFFLTGMAQFAILVAATRLLFGIQWGPLLPLGVMAAATVLAAGGMGLFLAGIIRTQEQQVTVGVLFINATSMLGGVYWDLSMVSPAMQRIGYLTPQAWAIDGFREVMLRGGAWSGLMWPLVVLLGITAVFLTAGVLRVRYE